jgi:hypothetical protein
LFSSSLVFENCGKSQNNTKAKTMKFNVKSTWLGFPFIYIYIIYFWETTSMKRKGTNNNILKKVYKVIRGFVSTC